MSNSSPRRSKRLLEQQRFDYKEYNKTGNKIPKAGNSTMATKTDDLVLQLESLHEDIVDHFDENDIESFLVIEDINDSVSKLEALRTQYRSSSQCLKKLKLPEYDEKYLQVHEEMLQKIKGYILHAKEKKKLLRMSEVDIKKEERITKDYKDKEDALRCNQASEFLLTEIRRLLDDLAKEFGKDGVTTDDEIIRRKNDLPENLLLLERLSNKVKSFLEMVPDNYPNRDNVVREVTQKYKSLTDQKVIYEAHLSKEIHDREITKEISFQTSSLNIKLEKFKGFASETDVYSFHSDFEKLYLRCTPTKMLPDLLKNNHLANPALALVKSLEEINEIWERLHKAYGDPKVLLKRKLSEVTRIGPLWKLKNPESLKEGLVNLINAISDLIRLSEKHGIEQKLYHGEGLSMIYQMMGDARVTRWLSKISDENLEEEDLWQKLIKFLEKELRVQQEKLLLNFNVSDMVVPKDSSKSKRGGYVTGNGKGKGECHFCGEEGHVSTNGPDGYSIIQYFACKKFVELNPAQRFRELRSKGFCCQCLYPGAKQSTGKHATGKCQTDFICTHENHKKYPVKKHILVCQEHCLSNENQKVLDEYKGRCILKQKAPLESFSKDIKLSFVAYTSAKKGKAKTQSNDDDIIVDDGIYILQTISVDNNSFTIFFDTGCSDFVSRHKAVEKMGKHAIQEFDGPINLGGVGDSTAVSTHGAYQIRLPLHNGKNAVFSGVCLDKITTTFPQYPLNGAVRNDIHHAFKSAGHNINNLPSFPDYVGGDVDFMVGIKYKRYHPEEVFSLPSGLTVYRSAFVNEDGSRGVIGGPHAVFTELFKSFNCKVAQHSYLSEQYKLFKIGYQLNPDCYMLGAKGKEFDLIDEASEDLRNQHLKESTEDASYLSARKQKAFEDTESAASEVTYRCTDCRNCQKCRSGANIEIISIKEEIEQDVINKSVNVDVKKGITTAKLPFMHNPVLKLAPNKGKALAVYKSQVKKLNSNKQAMEDVIKSEGKLQQMGYVDYIENLPSDQKQKLLDSPIQNFLPWRSVWNENSLSTPCRIVFDGSQATSSSYSINDLLAKGRNNMNRLVEIFIRWSSYSYAFHCDIQKMYNSVRLCQEDWCYQRYIWQQDLNPEIIPKEKVIKTLIYGIKSSGNQAEKGLRKTAELFKEDYPEVASIVSKDIYVDDCMSGEVSQDKVFQRADELTLVLKRGGFNLKGFTFSGQPPLESLSGNSDTINVAGMKWNSEEDVLYLDVKELNFAQKKRGKKSTVGTNVIPERLTRRQCVGKVAELYDLTGRITPLTAHMKLDLRILVKQNLDWDDAIPDHLKNTWLDHFETITKVGQLKFQRCIIPSDAVNTDIHTVDTADASKEVACSAIYARILKKCGKYSCQLVFARSKLLPEGITQPRAELVAALMNAHTGEVVKRAFGEKHKSAVKLTDSQIVLHWLNNTELPLKQWVRNRIVDILRFTKPDDWCYVSSSNMIADLGTRRNAMIDDVAEGSLWSSGMEWMKSCPSDFPVKTYEEVRENLVECAEAKKELIVGESFSKDVSSGAFVVSPERCLQEVAKRLEFSDYIFNPNKYLFDKSVRIIAYLKRFINNCRERVKKKSAVINVDSVAEDVDMLNEDGEREIVILSDEEIQTAANYYYKKGTLEVKEFMKKDVYEKLSFEKDDILLYKGRILPTQQIEAVVPLTETMKDLTNTTFCVPIVDKFSPIGLGVINEVHWNHKVAKHSGVETILRYTLEYCHIIEGREIVKMIGRSCQRCRYLRKRTIDVIMGPVSSHLTIAPAFFVSQVDLAGPFKSYSPHNKRNTVKIWFAVFCCLSTSTVGIRVMESYSTDAFIQAFIRLSCEVGYPKVLLTDLGSQLVSSCESMTFSFKDLQNKLYTGMKVELETCPVGGHNFHGKVERKIRQIRESIEKSMQNERISILQWETLVSEVANSINNLPIGYTNYSNDLESIDLLTPNRLKLGRNNDRSPVEPLFVTHKCDKFLKENKRIFNSWFEHWLISYVPTLMHQSKWFHDDVELSVGDIVLFVKQEGDLSKYYQYGMIESVQRSKDNKVRTVNVKYRNHNEKVNRLTQRAVRELILIHHIDELDITTELGVVATAADVKRKLSLQCKH